MTCVLIIDQKVIQINNDKGIKLVQQDLIDITLGTNQSIEKTERHHLVFQVIILSLKGCLLFITILYLNSMIKTCKIDLCETSSLT